MKQLPGQLVDKLPAIEVLDVSQNQLDNLTDLEQLQTAVHLRELLLHGNPCTAKAGQANIHAPEDGLAFSQSLHADPADPLTHLMAKLPSLQLLDGKPVPKIHGTVQASSNGGSGGTFELTSTLPSHRRLP